jgi:polar amino acid transport system permease protein
MASPYRPLRAVSRAVVELFRAMPLLVLIIWLYYVFPAAFGLSFTGFWTSGIALAFSLAAFVADILRGSIGAIPEAHLDAGRSIGMSKRILIRRIIVPEAFRRSVPGLTALYISGFKLSTLASIVSVSELLFVSESVVLKYYKPLEIYTAVAVIYLALIIPATILARYIEQHRYFSISPHSR